MSLWRFLRVCCLLLRGLYTAQRYTSIFYKLSIANLQIRILLAEDVRYPKAADIMAQGLGTHQPKTVLLAHMLKLYSGHIFFELSSQCSATMARLILRV